MKNDISLNSPIYKTLFEISPEGLAFCDQSGRILMVNDEFCRMFGYEREEIVGRNLDEVVAQQASSLDEAKKRGEEYSRSGILQIEVTRQKKDGDYFLPVSVVTTPVMVDGSHHGSLTIYRDISERRKREDEIRISEAKLRGILESHPELILRFTPDLVTTYANKTYCDYHGITYEDAVGRPFADSI
ncbi:MAG: PAS domain S-box protein, partial [Thermovirgaceae bacterium]|nr:PAS domain S-box protein [Thermovirgaceae bacterium]